MVSTIKTAETDFIHALKHIYDERECKNMYSWLLEDLFAWNRSDQLLKQDILFTKDEYQRFTKAMSELVTGKPYQYIVGFGYFHELKIQVNEAVLIPRPETEELVELILQENKNQSNILIEDWCTGSGCIALALKNLLPAADVHGFDISQEALSCAELNAKELAINVNFETKDALNITHSDRKVDIIVSNPPYISWDEKTKMRQNVIDFEPSIALFVDDADVCLFYKKITEYALSSLKIGGKLYFELHEDYANDVSHFVKNTKRFEARIVQDLQGKNRMLSAELIA